ncbi:MAG: 7-carboxy-7-deazaguanine synthase QueE [Planctomycetes bacterium]|nr:7-carboxy-7-deazaguanine synthase QueE [Planctomycetota bacterium]
MANIVEVFSSFQGEGLFVGQPQLFIRLGGCNLHCSYCDTTNAQKPVKTARIETKPFSRKFITVRNSISAEQLLDYVNKCISQYPFYHAISLTGGEPLMQSAFLGEFSHRLHRFHKMPILLETNGTLPENLKEIINLIDIVSMDIKIPIQKEESLRSLRLCGDKAYIKIVVCADTPERDLSTACRLVAKVNRNIPVILQPVSPVRRGIRAPSVDKLFRIYHLFRKHLQDVRIIPQVHRVMKWL